LKTSTFVGWVLCACALAPETGAAFNGATTAGIDPENNGFLLLQSSKAMCTAVMVTDDTFVTSKQCLHDSGSDRAHPELVGWMMGSKNDDDNPIRELHYSDDYAGAAPSLVVGRLHHAPYGYGHTTHFPLYRGTNATIIGQHLKCFSYGINNLTDIRTYGEFLTASADSGDLAFTAQTAGAGAVVFMAGPRTDFSDTGGVCLTTTAPFEAAVIVQSSALFLRLGDAVREWVTAFTTEVELRSEQSPNNCLEVPEGSFTHGTALVQARCTGSARQRFRLRPEFGVSAAYGVPYQLRSVSSGAEPVSMNRTRLEQCVSIGAANPADGQPAIQWPCAQVIGNPFAIPTEVSADQKWFISYVPLSNGAVQLRNVATNKCLAVPTTAPGGNAAIQLTCADVADQRFRINALDFGHDAFALETHQLVGDQERYLDVWNMGGAGADVRCYSNTAGTNQRFKFNDWALLLHYKTFAAQHTGFLYNVTSTGTPVGSTVIQKAATTDADQQWRFEWHPQWGTRPASYAVRSKANDAQCIVTKSDYTLDLELCADGLLGGFDYGHPLYEQRTTVR
jgi:hypothetical protein